MPGSTALHSLDYEEKIKEAAFMMASSITFQTYFVTKATPAQWEKVLRTWDEEALNTALLILKEEASMIKDIKLLTARQNKVNDTRLLQRLEKIRVDAHSVKHN